MCIRDRDATLQIRDNRAHASTMTDTLSGRISGAGSLVLGHKAGGGFPGGGRYAISGDNSGFTGTFKPVSYTHLDVYKRQGMWSPKAC